MIESCDRGVWRSHNLCNCRRRYAGYFCISAEITVGLTLCGWMILQSQGSMYGNRRYLQEVDGNERSI